MIEWSYENASKSVGRKSSIDDTERFTIDRTNILRKSRK